MTTPRDPDRQIHAFLLEGDDLLNDQVYDVVRAEIERKRQRTFIGPWRTPIMNKLLTYGLGAAAVVVILFGASQFFGSPSGGTGAEPTATATPEATVEPTPTPVAAPPLNQTFTSTIHGISMSYPEGWSVQAATKPWKAETFQVSFTATLADDLMYDPILMDHLFLAVASQPIGDSTPEEWVASQMSSGEGCAATEPITVDGASGQIGAEGCDVAVVTTAGRGYWIELLTSGDDPAAVAAYDRAWFEEVLATVQLQPEDAVD